MNWVVNLLIINALKLLIQNYGHRKSTNTD